MSYQVNDPATNIDGTSLQGRVRLSYADLVDRLGEPGPLGDDYKTDAEWTLEYEDGEVATIYNYKTGPNYLGPEGTPVVDITDWHVGGRTTEVLHRVLDLFGLDHESADDERYGPFRVYERSTE